MNSWLIENTQCPGTSIATRATSSRSVHACAIAARKKSFTVTPPKGHKNYELVDQHLKARIPVTAGPHQLGVTFVKNPSELLETKRQPYEAHFNLHRHPRLSPAVYQVSITGPYGASAAGDGRPTTSFRRVEEDGRLRESRSAAAFLLR